MAPPPHNPLQTLRSWCSKRLLCADDVPVNQYSRCEQMISPPRGRVLRRRQRNFCFPALLYGK